MNNSQKTDVSVHYHNTPNAVINELVGETFPLGCVVVFIGTVRHASLLVVSFMSNKNYKLPPFATRFETFQALVSAYPPTPRSLPPCTLSPVSYPYQNCFRTPNLPISATLP